MPNGRHLPYALGGGPNGSHDVPSPLDTSDEEDVWVVKHRWRLLGRWVYGRWLLFVAKRRANASRGGVVDSELVRMSCLGPFGGIEDATQPKCSLEEEEEED